MLTDQQFTELSEMVKENDRNQLYWKNADGSKKLLCEATQEELTKWKEFCNSMLYSTDNKQLGKENIYKQIEEQKNLCNAELFVRYLVSNENLKLSKFSLGNIFINFIANNLHIEDIENQPISIMLDNLDPIFSTVTIKNGRNACLNQLGTFKKYFTNKFIYNSGIWINSKDTKQLNLPKQASTKEKLQALKQLCNIDSSVMLKFNQNGLSLTEFKTAINIRNKNYSALSTNELVLLRDKLLNNYQLVLLKQINMWKTRLNNINSFLNENQ